MENNFLLIGMIGLMGILVLFIYYNEGKSNKNIEEYKASSTGAKVAGVVAAVAINSAVNSTNRSIGLSRRCYNVNDCPVEYPSCIKGVGNIYGECVRHRVTPSLERTVARGLVNALIR